MSVERRCYYFGCWGDVGHYLWDGDQRPPRMLRPAAVLPAALHQLDAPYPPHAELKYVPPELQVQGLGRLSHVDGWTVLAFWDRSVDRRPGSHSTFVAEGAHGYDAMVALCRARFPSVWARYTFDVIPFGGSR